MRLGDSARKGRKDYFYTNQERGLYDVVLSDRKAIVTLLLKAAEDQFGKERDLEIRFIVNLGEGNISSFHKKRQKESADGYLWIEQLNVIERLDRDAVEKKVGPEADKILEEIMQSSQGVSVEVGEI
jgi:hypothetical protein